MSAKCTKCGELLIQVPSGHCYPLGHRRIVQILNRQSQGRQAATVDGIQDEVQRIAIGTDHPMPHVIRFLNDKVSHKSLVRFAAHLALGRKRKRLGGDTRRAVYGSNPNQPYSKASYR